MSDVESFGDECKSLTDSFNIPDYLAVVDEIEPAFLKCWETLADIRVLHFGNKPLEFLADFQIGLAESIFRLDEVYRQLGACKSRVVANKYAFSPDMFLEKVRACERGRSVLVRAMTIGRALGDAFAWFFCSRDQESVQKHFSHQPIPHSPPGLGGQAELAFLRSMRSNTHLIIYHGITSFLRVGDFSFFDFKNLTVTAIGELKARFIPPNQATLELFLIVQKNEHAPALFRLVSQDRIIVPGEQPYKERMQGPEKLRQDARAKRQLKVMGQVFKKPDSPQKADMYESYYTNALSKISAEIAKGVSSFQKVSDGLLVYGLMLGQEVRLSARLAVELRIESVLPSSTELAKQTRTILAAPKELNSLFIGGSDLATNVGIIPLFWLPAGISIDFLRKIYFQEAHFVIFFTLEFSWRGCRI